MIHNTRMATANATFQSEEEEINSASLELICKEEIFNGIHLVAQYLGSEELPNISDRTQNVANGIYYMFQSYRKGIRGIKKSTEVTVCIDTERISVEGKNDGKAFLVVLLTNVLDVTMSLSPCPNICVLVIRQTKRTRHTMHVFHCKGKRRAIQFYKATSLAFQLDIQRQKKSPSDITKERNDDVEEVRCYRTRNSHENIPKPKGNITRFGSSITRRRNSNLFPNTSARHKESKSRVGVEEAIELNDLTHKMFS